MAAPQTDRSNSWADPASQPSGTGFDTAATGNGGTTAEEAHAPSGRNNGGLFGLIWRRIARYLGSDRSPVDPATHEHALRRLAAYEQLSSATTDLLICLDRDYTILTANEAYCNTMGRSAEEVLGRRIPDISDPKHFTERVKPLLDEVLTGTTLHKQTWMDLDGSGSTRFYDARWNPVLDARGSVIGIAGVHRDITQRKQYNDRVRMLARHESLRLGQFEHFARAATELFTEADTIVAVSVWRRDEVKNTLNCIDRYEARRGEHSGGATFDSETTEEYAAVFEKQNLIMITAEGEDPQLPAARRVALDEAGLCTALESPITVAGKFVGFVALELAPEGQTWTNEQVAAARDLADLAARTLISEERRALEQQLIRAQKMESLGVLTGGIAHDFNNLLVGVIGATELALDELSPDSSTREHLELALSSSEQAAALCRQMLVYSGHERRSVSRRRLNKIVEETTHVLRSNLPRGIEQHLRLTAEDPVVEVDGTQLAQVIMNMITNSADAYEGESGKISIQSGTWDGAIGELSNVILGSDSDSTRYAYVEVADDGCGMDEPTRTQMFDPFFTTKFTGRGLGLSAVLGIVRGHRGAMTLTTAPDRGTTLRVYLPVAPSTTLADAPPKRRLASISGSVLVVDDDRTVGHVAAAMLTRAGLQPTVAESGAEALEEFNARKEDVPFDLVVLDLTMPGMDGREVGRRLRQVDQDVPIIISTGFGEMDVKELKELRIAGFLQKPYTRANLESILSDLDLRGP